jgi:hypothetical protein
MKTKIDARIDRAAAPQNKPKSPLGGKVLQRLFAYLGQRDPNLNSDVVATVAVPVAARPRFGLTKMAMRAGPVTVAKVRRKGGASSAAKSFASAIISAAAAISRRPRKAARRSAKPRMAAAPAGPAAAITAGWQFIGPSVIPNGQTYGTNRVEVSGRVSSIAVDPNNPKHILLGAAGGGIWESPDSGATWSPRSDFLPSLAIGAITFDRSNPAKVYAGSGEGNFYAQLGAGVYRSTDGGTTWAVLASAPFVGVGFYDLVVDKTPTILYAATTNGFYRSTNGGTTWSVRRAVKCWDISVHPNGGATEILAAFADGLFVSTNGGTSFSPVSLPSAPTSAWTRLAVDRVTISPDVAYVFGAAGSAAHLWRRAGATWTKITGLPALNITQAWYDWYVAAPPDNLKQVFIGAIDAWRGTLATGWSWKNITTQGAKSIHPDQHCLTFSPGNSKIIYAGNDGGIFRSIDSGDNWTAQNKGLGISELEYLGSNPTTWKWIMAGTQDNGTARFTGAATLAWDHIADGDGGDCGVNQFSPNIVYHSYYGVSLERSTTSGNFGSWTNLAPPAANALFYPPVEVFGTTVAIGAASFIVTRTGINPWTSVPLGLASGEVPTAMRAVNINTIVIGTNAGRVLRMAWNGSAWIRTMLTAPAAGRYISCVAVDPTNPMRYWVTLSQLGGGRVFRSDDAGVTWVNCTPGLPNIPINAVVVDPANFKRVWVAADVGVYQSLSLGASWASFAVALPNAMAADLILHKQDRKLICAMRNRGAWVIDV